MCFLKANCVNQGNNAFRHVPNHDFNHLGRRDAAMNAKMLKTLPIVLGFFEPLRVLWKI
jgi:hypothetical protein